MCLYQMQFDYFYKWKRISQKFLELLKDKKLPSQKGRTEKFPFEFWFARIW